ncbi:MAG: sulfite exporter TauE/SafE family protein [Burkholderiales bacterium]|jgi:uncharacterized membrane protein YfcA|nr:sulfite exporter TauE/SafE family protein [Betaproteobacteria bacterium]
MVATAIFFASVLSGMLGVGVAVLAIPILSVTDSNLVGSVQPLALLLNGLTALFAAIPFAYAGLVDWRKSGTLAFVMCFFAPVGALLASRVPLNLLWGFFFCAAALVLLMLVRPSKRQQVITFNQIVIASAPICLLCSMLGMGPGFILVPLMMSSGNTARQSAAINSVAVVPSSLAAFLMHRGSGAQVSASWGAPIIMAACGALVGAYWSTKMKGERPLKILFGTFVLAACAYKAVLIYR